MPTLKHTNDDVEATYFFSRDGGKDGPKRFCLCHPDYPEDKKQEGVTYAPSMKLTAEEAERFAVVIRGGNLTVVTEAKKKKAA